MLVFAVRIEFPGVLLDDRSILEHHLEMIMDGTRERALATFNGEFQEHG